MKNYVTSIEQSRRLLELGVPAEKASMIYQSHFTQGEPKLYAQPYQVNGYPPKEKIREDVVPAFTVANLLESVIPSLIDDGYCIYKLVLEASFASKWILYYKPVSDPDLPILDVKKGDILIDILCDCVEFLKKNRCILSD